MRRVLGCEFVSLKSHQVHGKLEQELNSDTEWTKLVLKTTPKPTELC